MATTSKTNSSSLNLASNMVSFATSDPVAIISPVITLIPTTLPHPTLNLPAPAIPSFPSLPVTHDILAGSPSLGSIHNLLHIKLSNTNYLVWKMKFTPLNCFGLQSLVDSTIPAPTPSLTCSVYLTW